MEKIERMDEVRVPTSRTSEPRLLQVPYTFEGRPGNYYPDYILKIDDGRGIADLLHLIVEISGRELKEKEAKVETVKSLWIPAVNNESVFGRWAFLELDNTEKAMQTIRKLSATKDITTKHTKNTKRKTEGRVPDINKGSGHFPSVLFLSFFSCVSCVSW